MQAWQLAAEIGLQAFFLIPELRSSRAPPLAPAGLSCVGVGLALHCFCSMGRHACRTAHVFHSGNFAEWSLLRGRHTCRMPHVFPLWMDRCVAMTLFQLESWKTRRCESCSCAWELQVYIQPSLTLMRVATREACLEASKDFSGDCWLQLVGSDFRAIELQLCRKHLVF